MKLSVALPLILFPLSAAAESTVGYAALDRLAAVVFGAPIAGIIGAIVFTITLKKLSYPGISKFLIGLAGGIVGATAYTQILQKTVVVPSLLSAFVGGYLFAAILGWIKKSK